MPELCPEVHFQNIKPNELNVVGVVSFDGEFVEEFEEEAEEEADFEWFDDKIAKTNYEAMGKRLALSGDLFRKTNHGGGLVQLLPDSKHVEITKGTELSPVIVDRVKVMVIKGGKNKGSRINSADLNAMLKSEVFLKQFDPVDRVTTVPLYLPDFTLTVPGLNDGGSGSRIYFIGGKAGVSDKMDTINAFLDVMQFASNADRTNAVGAALTVLLHNHWQGGKPVILVTATKSHAGKDTVILFTTGTNKSVSISYQSKNWAFERNFGEAIKSNPDVGVVVIDNARLDGREKVIASAFLERFATDPEPLLSAPGTGKSVRLRNDFLMAISTNFGCVSEDIMNRSLPIHLNPTGNIADRVCPIGNPKLEFLPANQEQIAAELRGMIERWKEAGKPLDDSVSHSFTPWAKAIGGILKVNGFSDFLANCACRKTADDPIRKGLAILGSTRPDRWQTPSEWATDVVDLGLDRTLIPTADQRSDKSRVRGVGVVLSNHHDESLIAETDDGIITLKLEKERRRQDGGEPKVRYRFKTVTSAGGAS